MLAVFVFPALLWWKLQEREVGHSIGIPFYSWFNIAVAVVMAVAYYATLSD
jgi:hypothetical protein